jgi:hypothetical protein
MKLTTVRVGLQLLIFTASSSTTFVKCFGLSFFVSRTCRYLFDFFQVDASNLPDDLKGDSFSRIEVRRYSRLGHV